MTETPPKARVQQPISPPALHNDQPTWPNAVLSQQHAVEAGATNDELAVRRLIVLVPDEDIDENEIARRIWELASPAGLNILWFGLCKNTDDEARMRRRLVTLAALTRDPRIKVETKLEFGANWNQKLKPILIPGDIMICHAEQQTGLWRQPLSQRLSELGMPVWTLTNFYMPMKATPRSPLKEAVFWVVALAILAGFLWLQSQIIRLPKDWAHHAMLYLSVFIEVGLLWIWHNVSS